MSALNSIKRIFWLILFSVGSYANELTDAIVEGNQLAFLKVLANANDSLLNGPAISPLKVAWDNYKGKKYQRDMIAILATHVLLKSKDIDINYFDGDKRKNHLASLIKKSLALKRLPITSTSAARDDDEDFTKFLNAIEDNKSSVVMSSLKSPRSSELVNLHNSRGANAMDIALEMRHLEIVKTLARHGIGSRNKTESFNRRRLYSLAQLEEDLYEQALLTIVLRNFGLGLEEELIGTFLRAESSYLSGIVGFWSTAGSLSKLKNQISNDIAKVKHNCKESDINEAPSKKCEQSLLKSLIRIKENLKTKKNALSPERRFFWTLHELIHERLRGETSGIIKVRYLNLIFLRLINPMLMKDEKGDFDKQHLSFVKLLQNLVNLQSYNVMSSDEKVNRLSMNGISVTETIPKFSEELLKAAKREFGMIYRICTLKNEKKK